MRSVIGKILSFILILLITIQVVSGFYGSYMLISDPYGSSFISAEFLKGTSFDSYLIPGLILLILLSIFPLLALIGLIFRPEWKWIDLINIRKSTHWGLTFALYTGLMLIIWIGTQVRMIGSVHPLQPVIMILGILITALCLIPSVKRNYKII